MFSKQETILLNPCCEDRRESSLRGCGFRENIYHKRNYSTFLNAKEKDSRTDTGPYKCSVVNS